MHLCQHSSPKYWFANVNMTSYCDVTNIVYPVTMTTIRHCSILEFGWGHTIKQPARASPDLDTPLKSTDSYWEIICTASCNVVHLHLTLLPYLFKCLMLFTNLHFSSIIQHSCMENKWSSCLWIVSEFASHQYCFCVVNMWTLCTHQAWKSKKCWENVLLLSRLDTY